MAGKYTSPGRLCIQGRSAGGLTMGAVLNLRPDLFHGGAAGGWPGPARVARAGRRRCHQGRCCSRGEDLRSGLWGCFAVVLAGSWSRRHNRSGPPHPAAPHPVPQCARLCAAILGVPFVDCLTTMLDETIPLTGGCHTAGLCVCAAYCTARQGTATGSRGRGQHGPSGLLPGAPGSGVEQAVGPAFPRFWPARLARPALALHPPFVRSDRVGGVGQPSGEGVLRVHEGGQPRAAWVYSGRWAGLGRMAAAPRRLWRARAPTRGFAPAAPRFHPPHALPAHPARQAYSRVHTVQVLKFGRNAVRPPQSTDCASPPWSHAHTLPASPTPRWTTSGRPPTPTCWCWRACTTRAWVSWRQRGGWGQQQVAWGQAAQ